MKLTRTRTVSLIVLTAGLLAALPPAAPGQNAEDQIEVARSVIKADRQAAVAAALQLTEAESKAFWPLYHQYRSDMDKIVDGLMKLVREYASLYPDVPEDRAKRMLGDLTSLEQKWANQRAAYMQKFTKVLPATKTLRFAQVETRLDIALRLQISSAVPLVPTKVDK